MHGLRQYCPPKVVARKLQTQEFTNLSPQIPKSTNVTQRKPSLQLPPSHSPMRPEIGLRGIVTESARQSPTDFLWPPTSPHFLLSMVEKEKNTPLHRYSSSFLSCCYGNDLSSSSKEHNGEKRGHTKIIPPSHA